MCITRYSHLSTAVERRLKVISRIGDLVTLCYRHNPSRLTTWRIANKPTDDAPCLRYYSKVLVQVGGPPLKPKHSYERHPKRASITLLSRSEFRICAHHKLKGFIVLEHKPTTQRSAWKRSTTPSTNIPTLRRNPFVRSFLVYSHLVETPPSKVLSRSPSP